MHKLMYFASNPGILRKPSLIFWKPRTPNLILGLFGSGSHPKTICGQRLSQNSGLIGRPGGNIRHQAVSEQGNISGRRA
jgi:hypothetical protein